jgi:hypothetical protein
VEILDDPKMGRMSDRLWRRTVELFLIAGENRADGLLPSLSDMAWRLRPISEEELEADLVELARTGITEQRDGAWWIASFAERQAAEGTAERSKHYRQKRRIAEPVTPDAGVRDEHATTRDIDLDQDLDLERDREQTNPAGGISTELVRLGLSDSKAQELAGRFTSDDLRERMRQFGYALDAGICHGPGYLYRACVENWPPPKGYAPDPDSETQRARYVSGAFSEFVQR